MRFRLTTIAYVFALLAAAMATFGAWGIFVAGLVLGFWLLVAKTKPGVVEWLVIIAIIGTLIAFLLPAVEIGRSSYRTARCQNNLRQISLALVDYSARRGELPQAIQRDQNGVAMHSWRTMLLPTLDQQSLFERYRRDEPYNGPNNVLVTGIMIELFQCPSDPTINFPSSPTNYFAIVGTETAWPDDRSLLADEITDGRDHTIIVIEAAGLNVGWAEPRDLSFDDAIKLLIGKNQTGVVHLRYPSPGFFYRGFGKTVTGVHVAFASGRVAFLPTPISRKLATALLTAHAGDTVDMDELNQLTEPVLDYGKIVSFAAFAGLAIAPGLRCAVRGRKRGGGAPAAC